MDEAVQCLEEKKPSENGLKLDVDALSTVEFDKICRTCLQQVEITPIFSLNYENFSVCTLLKKWTSIQVDESDSLPTNICKDCLQKLILIQTFYKSCQQNDVILRTILQTRTKIEKSEENDESLPYESEQYTNESANSDDSTVEVEIKTESKRPLRRKTFRTRFKSEANSKHQPPFKCRDCPESFDSRELLREHRKASKHPEVRNYACEICSKMFTSSKLRQHMRAHTKEKPYVCSVCFQGFSMSGNLKRHMMTHTGERPHVCEICGKGFIQSTSLQSHRKTHANNERLGPGNTPKFICDYCGRGFKRLTPYNLHLQKHYGDTSGIQEVKKETQNEELREHVCEICKRAYKSKHLLKAHQLTHGEKSFLCNLCGKGFVTKAALLSHLKVHTGEKPHTCNICKKSFAHVGSFDAHMLIHTGQKPYKCNLCTKAFTQLSHLKYHSRTHSGERPYPCSYCNKRFALKGNLTVHIRTHTGETPYLCPICGKGFYDSSSMKKHKRGHGEINYENINMTTSIVNLQNL